MAQNEEITDEVWEDMNRSQGFTRFLDSIALAMDMHFNRRAANLLQFERDYVNSAQTVPIDEVLLRYGIYTANKNQNG